ncbi:MAG TPA: hypothetical protein VJY34_04760 [Roseiarcus sp.]|nr:hypothetical protein [Roseiarcus sp.]
MTMLPSPFILGVDIGNADAISVLTHDGDLVAPMTCRRFRTALPDAERSTLPFWPPGPTWNTSARGRERAVSPSDAAKGVIEGVMASLGLPIAFLTPPTWKRIVGIGPGKDMKDAARSEAIRRWPAQAALFAGKMGDGRAESALIGAAGLLRDARR